jgi:hypothetical protein
MTHLLEIEQWDIVISWLEFHRQACLRARKAALTGYRQTRSLKYKNESRYYKNAAGCCKYLLKQAEAKRERTIRAAGNADG